MKTIWKFEIPMGDLAEVQMPAGASILSIQAQKQGIWGVLCAWAMVDTDAPLVSRRFVVAGTGNPVTAPPDGALNFLGTAQFRDGALVLHAFEVIDEGAP